MDKDTLLDLCNALETHYGLKPSRRMNVIEKVGMFLFTLAVGASNRHVQERFQHSGETVSRCMKEVLKAVCLFAVDVIKPTDPEFTDTPIQIAMDPRFMPHFKPKIKFLLLVSCGFDMQFTFVWAGWEGSAHDTRIFYEAIDSRIINFPKPPQGCDLNVFFT
ncbi:protein ALP [Salix suchowensis]|nr:protein ALP [Salix suchowensis]